MMRIAQCSVFMLLVVVTIAHPRPRYIECLNSNECVVGTCCQLGQGKFNIPLCMPHGGPGAICRPMPKDPSEDAEDPRNVTLSYPDGQTIEFTNLYYLMCPCAHGLYCSEITHTCKDPYEDNKFNDLEYLA